MSGNMNNLEKALVEFQEFVHKVCSLDVFHSLMLSVLQISNKIKKENLSLQMRDWIDEILSASKLAKRIFSTDLSRFHTLLSKVISEMADRINDPSLVADRVRTLSNWVVGVQVDIENERTDNKLVDYVKELEELRDKFSELADVSKKVGSRNEQLRKTEEDLEKNFEAEKKRADRNQRNFEKATKGFEEIRAKYKELFEKYNELLVQKDNGQLGVSPGGRGGSPARDRKTIGAVWFDFEKAQERYEAMLDDLKNLVDQKNADIRRLENMIEETRLKRGKELEDLLDKNAQLDRDNASLLERIKSIKRELAEKDDELDKAKHQKSINEDYMDKEISQLRKKIASLEDEIDKLKSTLQAEREENERVKDDLEKKIFLLQNDLAEAAQREHDLLNGEIVKNGNTMAGMQLLPVSKVQDLEKKAEKLKQTLAVNEKITKDLADRNNTIKDITQQMGVMGDQVEKKMHENKRLREELEIRVVHESKDYKKATKLKTSNETLKGELGEKDKIIKELQTQIELLESKLVKITKMLDRLRFENQRNNSNTRLNHLYSSKIMGGSAGGSPSPGTNVGSIGGQNFRPTNSGARDMSPDPLLFPGMVQDNYSLSRAERNFIASMGQERPDDTLGYTRTMGLTDGAHQATTHEPTERAYSYCFLKANAEDYISPYMIREDHKLLVAGPVKTTGKYERTQNGAFINQRPYHFRQIFTQFDLDALSREFHSLYDNDKVLLVVYGSPLNIKLFVILKAVLAFLARVPTSGGEGEKECSVELLLQKKYAKVLEDQLIDQAGPGGIVVTQNDRNGDIVNIRLVRFIPTLIERCKKLFYEMLTQTSASTFNLVGITIRPLDARTETAKTLTIVRSQVSKLSNNHVFRESLGEMLTNYRDCDPVVEEYLNQKNWESYSKAMFLVLEPGKVNSYEESLELLEIHTTMEKLRLHPKTYDHLAMGRDPKLLLQNTRSVEDGTTPRPFGS